MTGSDIVSRMEYLVDDTSMSDAEALAQLNMLLEELSAEVPIQDVTTLQFKEGISSASLPTNTTRILWLRNGSTRLDPERPKENNSAITEFYDDITTLIDTDKWTATGTVVADGSTMKIGSVAGGDSHVVSAETTTNYDLSESHMVSLEFFGQMQQATGKDHIMGFQNFYFVEDTDDATYTYVTVDGGTTLYALDDDYAAADHTFRIEITANVAHFYVDNVLKKSLAHAEDDTGYLYFTSYDANDYTYVGHVKVSSVTTGAPRYFYVDDSTVYISPVPDEEYNLILVLEKGYTALAAIGGTPDVPTNFHRILVWGLAAQFAHADEDDSKVSKWAAYWERGKQDLKMYYLSRDGYPVVEDVYSHVGK